MSLLLPDVGLLFWMLVSFGVVFFVLYKYGFPVITSMLDERKRFIDESLRKAAEANERLAHYEREGEEILTEAREQKARILRETAETREQLLTEARRKAADECEKMVTEAKKAIQREKEDALREVKAQVADLSLAIAEKVVRNELSANEQQKKYTMELVEEALEEKKEKA